MRSPHSGVPGANLQSPYQQAPFSLHQKPEFLAYTDFSSSCLVPTPPHASYPRDDRPYAESQGGYQRAEWQFNPCEARARAPEACPQVVANPAAAVAAAAAGGGGGPELDGSVGAVAGCLDGGEYSPQSAASADSDKKGSGKRKREASGEWLWEGRPQGTAASPQQLQKHGRGAGIESAKRVWKSVTLVARKVAKL